MLTKARDLARFFYHQRVKGFDPPDDEPFMDPEGAARFKHELSRATGYLEFGSGGTTILADRAGIPAISVENDRFYARQVATRLSGNVEQVIIDTGITREWGFPLREKPGSAFAYARGVFRYLYPFPDFILVDGRWRVACALASAATARYCRSAATLMFDDYAERPHYHSIAQYLGEPEMAGRAAIFQIGKQAVPDKAFYEALADNR